MYIQPAGCFLAIHDELDTRFVNLHLLARSNPAFSIEQNSISLNKVKQQFKKWFSSPDHDIYVNLKTPITKIRKSKQPFNIFYKGKITNVIEGGISIVYKGRKYILSELMKRLVSQK